MSETAYTAGHAIRRGMFVLQPDGNWYEVTDVVMDGPLNLRLTLVRDGQTHEIRCGVMATLMTAEEA